MKASQKSLKKWTKEKWGTKSGKPSAKTGERYLPKKAREALTPAEYAATSAAKRKGTAAGKQFVKQPKKIAEKTKKFRASKGGLTMKKGYHKTKSGKMAKKGLYYNINKKKRAGTSNSKKKSTISAKAYRNMKSGFKK